LDRNRHFENRKKEDISAKKYVIKLKYLLHIDLLNLFLLEECKMNSIQNSYRWITELMYKIVCECNKHSNTNKTKITH
jgi:hypothetical protein